MMNKVFDNVHGLERGMRVYISNCTSISEQAN